MHSIGPSFPSLDSYSFVGEGLDPPAQIAMQFGISLREIMILSPAAMSFWCTKMTGRGKPLPYKLYPEVRL